MDQRDLSASLLSARSFSAFSDEGDHVHDDGGRGERRQRLLLRILGLSFEEPRAFWRWYRAVYGLLVLAATVGYRAARESEIPNFKGSYLGRFPLVSADFWTSDHLSERSRSVDAFSGTGLRETLTLKRS